MGNIISEGLEYIGMIDDDGYVFDRSGNRVAVINGSGYIGQIGGGQVYGKIDDDGTIRDASSNVVGRIQADGYVYIHSERVCKVSSKFIDSITPGAWNAGETSSYSGRSGSTVSDESESSSGSGWPFGLGTTLKLGVGTALGIWCIVSIGDTLGFPDCLLAIPVMIAVVYFVCFMIKFFNR